MSQTISSVGFDGVPPLIAYSVGMKNMKRVMTLDDVLRTYGIENSIRCKNLLSK